MFTKKQLLISLGLTIVGNALMVTAANADDISYTYLGGSHYIVPPGAGSYSLGGLIPGEGLAAGISIPPDMISAAGDGDTSNAGDGSGTSGKITVADIAEYYASNIDRALAELDTSTIAQEPRRIVIRRRASCDCACENTQSSQSSEKLKNFLSQAETFMDQFEKIKPEINAQRSIW